MDIITYALARKYVQDTLVGMGALKGAPCTIESITRVDGGNKIVFSWTGSDGSVQKQEMFVADGASGGGGSGGNGDNGGSGGTGSGLPSGGETGAFLMQGETGATWISPASDLEIVSEMIEADAMPTLIDAEGKTITDAETTILLMT